MQFARDLVDAKAVGAVRGDLELDDRATEGEHVRERRADAHFRRVEPGYRAGRGGTLPERDRTVALGGREDEDPVALEPEFESFAEQIIPRDSTPGASPS